MYQKQPVERRPCILVQSNTQKSTDITAVSLSSPSMNTSPALSECIHELIPALTIRDSEEIVIHLRT